MFCTQCIEYIVYTYVKDPHLAKQVAPVNTYLGHGLARVKDIYAIHVLRVTEVQVLRVQLGNFC